MVTLSGKDRQERMFLYGSVLCKRFSSALHWSWGGLGWLSRELNIVENSFRRIPSSVGVKN